MNSDLLPCDFISLPKGARDITGQRFGRLIALGPVNRKPITWLCVCDCGNTPTVSTGSLRNGGTLSCGCYRSDRCATVFTKHGLSRSPIQGIWRKIIRRCTSEKDKSYERYGGRGITICPEWQKDFLAFYSHVSQLEHFGVDGYSLDRIDNNSGYCPGNVRWATRSEQQRNRRNNHLVTFNGETKTVAGWAADLGLLRITLWTRLKRGWPHERALTALVNEQKKEDDEDGQFKANDRGTAL